MKRITGQVLAMTAALSLLVTGLAAQTEFTLVRQRTGSPIAGLGRYAFGYQGEAVASPEMTKTTKRPWLAALELVVPINVGVWVFDRYVFNKSYSRISWSSWKRNLGRAWIWDPDSLSASFFAHAYHASQFFNAARSLGLSFWESIPYTAGGYALWGVFFENDPPSLNDLIISIFGGANVGEVQYRFSSLVLDDTATGGNRVWREIAGFIIDPIRGLNRLLSGDVSKTSPENGELRQPFHGTLSFGGNFVSQTSGLSSSRFAPSFDFDLTYGIGNGEISSKHPYDLIFVNGGLRFGPDSTHFDIGTGGILFGQEFGREGGPRHVLGVFQFYDYNNNEIVRFGGASFTAGLVSLFPMKHGFELKTSVQIGVLALGGATNPYFLVQQRNYNYGAGLAARLQAWLTLSRAGVLSLRLNHFQSYTIEAARVSEATESHDFLTYLDASYTLPLSRSLGIRVDYGRCISRQRFEGRPDVNRDLSRIGGALEVRF